MYNEVLLFKDHLSTLKDQQVVLIANYLKQITSIDSKGTKTSTHPIPPPTWPWMQESRSWYFSHIYHTKFF